LQNVTIVLSIRTKKVLPEDDPISTETRRRKGDKYMYFIVYANYVAVLKT